MVGRSRPSSGGHVFGPFAFSGFDAPATGQATIPFRSPLSPAGSCLLTYQPIGRGQAGALAERTLSFKGHGFRRL